MVDTSKSASVAAEGMPRRRGAALERAIMAAARAELAEHGYAKATMSGVAGRAGTAKAVLYRRWRGLPELLLDMMGGRFATVTAPDTGELRADVLDLLRQIRTNLGDAPRDLVSGLIADTVHDQRLARRVHDLLAGSPLTKAMSTVLERAAGRGQIRPGPWPDRVVILPISLLRHDFVVFGNMPTDADLVAVTDEVFLPLLGYRCAGA